MWAKTTCARVFAKALNCRAKAPQDYEPCCECKSCVDIAKSRSADVVEVDSASSGSVASIRGIRDMSHYCTLGGGYRVWILDEVHSTSQEGFNALLKIMEEPPPKVVFLLCTTELTQVPDTILSRCFQLPFRGVTTDQVAVRLRDIAQKESLKVTDEVLELLASKGSGSVRDSLTLLDQLVAMYGRNLTKADAKDSLGVGTDHFVGELLISVFEQKPHQVITEFRKLWKLLPDSREFVRVVSEYLRDVVFLSQGLKEYIKQDRFVQVELISSKISDMMLSALLNRVSAVEKAMLHTRLNPQIVMEMWLLSLIPVNRLKTVADPVAVEAFWKNLL